MSKILYSESCSFYAFALTPENPFLITLYLPQIPVYVQGMILRVKVVKSACCFNNVLYPWIAELDYPPGLKVNKMIMLPALERPLKLGNILAELMLRY